MSLEVPGHYVWDFWLAQDGGEHHLFCLSAPRTSEHPDLRHPHARICHATSRDLRTWTWHGVALGPSETPAWDDGVTWTGSVIRKPDGQWMMFYTGCSLAEDRRIQRIGAAVSDDLYSWRKLPGPLLELTGDLYEQYDPARWHDQAFRDPWVYATPERGGYSMLFTARNPLRPAKGAGVIGRAHSPDLESWTLEQPITCPGHYGEMEVPQLFELDGWWYCLFSNSVRHREPAYIAGGGAGKATGTHYLRSRSPEGPFELVEETFFAGDDVGRFYGGRAVRDIDGRMALMAFRNHDADGAFLGTITDPMPLWTTAEGYLRLDGRQYGMALRDAPHVKAREAVPA